ncbi:phosphoadenylyl-sulfate reductase [uncultured Sphingomonas sp.]|uniref:phosphoadenylyl-sulfate reductase n=1 Tax=uncultured Sphingomonas sp. TaxID=158754 RepID=UPI0035CC645B
MPAVATPRPADLPAAVTARLEALAARAQGRIVFTTSFGLEDQMLTAIVAATAFPAALVTLDTGRLFPETLELWAETEARYGLRIRAMNPDTGAVEALIDADGVAGFRKSRDARLRCCHVRKVEPLGRALAGAGGWLTGLRGDRGTGATVEPLAWDDAHGLWKGAPLADWTRGDVAAWCAANAVPVNPLHAHGFPSIGCQPCTRAILPGEDERAGRWWWEASDTRECGLHVGADGRLQRAGPHP